MSYTDFWYCDNGLLPQNQRRRDTPVSLDKLSDSDKKGLKEGKASVGMTREGVLMALGYPAGHKTPSLQSNTWVYWQNRWKTIAVEFDENGKVKNIRD